jgi:hypothetical protein
MNEKANRNLQRLSRHNPSRIKELRHVFPIEMTGREGSEPLSDSTQILWIDS